MVNGAFRLSKPASILITGCSSGIGYATAKALQTRGYQVFATARKAKDVARLKQEGFSSYLLDVTDKASIEEALADILEETGGTLDALFNNGAYGQPGALEDLSTQALREQFETNLLGWHELNRRVIPIMRRQGKGKIIQHSSILGLVSLRFRGAYNASKYAIEGYTDTLRQELHGSGIHVITLNTGPVESRFAENALKMFEKHIDVEKSVFKEIYEEGVQKRLQQKSKKAPFTLGPEAVVKKVIHALESASPKARYYITTPSYLLAYLKRLLPTNVLDRLLYKFGD